MAAAFMDSNILLRHLLADHPEQSPRASEYLGRVERGEIQVHTSDTVVFEVVFTLEWLYRQSKRAIGEALLPLLEMPGINLPGKRRYRRAFDLYIERNLPFADAYHVAGMESLGIDQVLSFDRHFDRVPGITRIEP
jgi:predicted nucleic acid-binding protein